MSTNTDPMALHHQSADETVDRLVDMQQDAAKRLVTMPAVGNDEGRDTERRNYLGVRNNAYQLSALWTEFGLRTLVTQLVEQERKLQRETARDSE